MSNQLGKRVARLMAAAPFLFVLACGGCGYSYTFKTGLPSSSTRVTETEQQGLFGWVSNNVYDLDKACPNGVSEFGSYISFTNWLPVILHARPLHAADRVRRLLGRRFEMSRIVAALAACLVVTGCGPHRITFIRSSLAGKDAYSVRRTHAHGIGPLIVGGGGFFGIVDEMSPALVDYTGPVNTADVCPHGFYKVSHHHAFWQSLLAGLISWGAVVNAYHQSYVNFSCLRQ